MKNNHEYNNNVDTINQFNDTMENDTVIVNYLPNYIDDYKLTDLFNKYGKIIFASVIRNKKTQSSLGYGFVRYSSVKEAHKAIDAMNGYILSNKTFKVGFALPAKTKKYAKIYVTGLPEKYTDKDTYNLFKQFGSIVELRLPNQSICITGVAFIIYDNIESARAALSLDGKTIDNNSKAKTLMVQLIEKSSNEQTFNFEQTILSTYNDFNKIQKSDSLDSNNNVNSNLLNRKVSNSRPKNAYDNCSDLQLYDRDDKSVKFMNNSNSNSPVNVTAIAIDIPTQNISTNGYHIVSPYNPVRYSNQFVNYNYDPNAYNHMNHHYQYGYYNNVNSPMINAANLNHSPYYLSNYYIPQLPQYNYHPKTLRFHFIHPSDNLVSLITSVVPIISFRTHLVNDNSNYSIEYAEVILAHSDYIRTVINTMTNARINYFNVVVN